MNWGLRWCLQRIGVFCISLMKNLYDLYVGYHKFLNKLQNLCDFLREEKYIKITTTINNQDYVIRYYRSSALNLRKPWFYINKKKVSFFAEEVEWADFFQNKYILVNLRNTKKEGRNILCFDLNGKKLWRIEPPRYKNGHLVKRNYRLNRSAYTRDDEVDMRSFEQLTSKKGNLLVYVLYAFGLDLHRSESMWKDAILYEIDIKRGKIIDIHEKKAYADIQNYFIQDSLIINNKKYKIEFYKNIGNKNKTHKNWFLLNGKKISFPNKKVIRVKFLKNQFIIGNIKDKNKKGNNIKCFNLQGEQIWESELPKNNNGKIINKNYRTFLGRNSWKTSLSKEGNLLVFIANILNKHIQFFSSEAYKKHILYELDLQTGKIVNKHQASKPETLQLLS